MFLPLSAKILAWFFLNLAVLATVFILLFNAQFRFDLDWVFESNARQRVEAMRALIVGELNTTPPDDWGAVLERFSDAYAVRLSIFESNGEYLIGPVTELPPELRQRMLTPTPTPKPLAYPKASIPKKPAAPPSVLPKPNVASKPKPAPPHARPTPNSMRAFLRTSHPAHYWLLQRARLNNPQAGGAMQVILVAQADSLSMGGLILDPAPWLGLAVGTIAFSVLFWFPLLHGITRSIGQMRQTTRQIAEGRFDVRVVTRRQDELGSLGESINQMAARLNGFVAGQKRFLGDIAHELCSPLARLQMVLGIMEQRAGKEGAEYAKSASEKAQQIAALVNELLVFSRASFGPAAVRLAPVVVGQVVAEAVCRETDEAVRITTEIPGGLTVLADGELLVRAVSNLLRNAIHHGGNSGPITLAAAREQEGVAIRVADCGPGVPEEELPKLFDAFYRLDSSRARETGGVGLGLTIVKTCVESCGGTVVAQNREPHGLEVVIRLPAPVE
ncbi:MAG: ATP-binding protein [Verrucomicrobia bacterium]|nr:ATP-binding protein [Verrucomicrobiota bacterium]